MTDLEAVRKTWNVERLQYERFGQELALRLRAGLRREGIWAEVTSRAKEVDSLIRKLIKKPKYTYETLGDRAGVRVILRYKDEVEPTLKLAAKLFECSEPEHKVDTLQPDQVGYLSAHVDVKFRTDDPLGYEYPPERFRAEVQVRTLAQHLWSEMSHDTFYKNDETLNPLPKTIQRRVYVLAGVVELADDEFSRVSREMPTVPEVDLLKALERHYYKLTVRRGDPEISLAVIRLLIPLYRQEPRQIISYLNDFYATNEDVLREVYEQAEAAADRSVFLYQPEALMIYDRLKADPLGTRQVWNEQYPERELERIAHAFGISFD